MDPDFMKKNPRADYPVELWSEEELSKEIDILKDKLTILFAARRRRFTTLNPDMFWCHGCGQHPLRRGKGLFCDQCRTYQAPDEPIIPKV